MGYLEVVSDLVFFFFSSVDTFLHLQARNISTEKRSLLSEVIFKVFASKLLYFVGNLLTALLGHQALLESFRTSML